MIKRINKIKKFGIFEDFKWDSSMPEFKQFNLIYGWNGCGKTTLTRLFYALSNLENTEYPDAEFEVQDDKSNKYKLQDRYPHKIRIFNQDYVNKNIKLLEGKAEGIFILGEENQELVEQIEKDEAKLTKVHTEVKECKDNMAGLQKTRGSKFTEIAKTISVGTKGSLIRNYTKTHAEKAFQKMRGKAELSEEDLNRHLQTVVQDVKPEISEIKLPKSADNREKFEVALASIQTEIKSLLGKTVEAIVIERLKDNADISNWVETGMQIHKEHDSKSCEFCGNNVAENRLKDLSNHFNDADQKLKGEIDTLLERLRSLYRGLESVNAPDVANFYKELEDSYRNEFGSFTLEKTKILSAIAEVGKELESKKTKTTEKLIPQKLVDVSHLLAKTESFNTIINSHNKKTQEFDKAKQSAKDAIEQHFLSTIYDEVVAIDKELEGCEELQRTLTYGEAGKNESIQTIQNRISENKKLVTSAHKACDEINSYLETFLGRSELVFKVDGEGYLILRGDKPATMLSEGEKTAIAFVYFVIQLKDQNFKSEEGIIVIDDPISSLDSNSLFQAFSFIKNAVSNCMQMFVFTHNYEFLRLLLNWLEHRSNKPKASYYMIKNKYVNEQRQASIDKLDNLLQDYHSEYQYLFKVLYQFGPDEGTIESAYHMPNVARKVLDTFLMFMVPNSESVYTKLQGIDFDENKKTAIYKFCNDQSHITGKGFDPSLVEEARKNTNYLLEMIKAVFPQHYQVLEQAINAS